MGSKSVPFLMLKLRKSSDARKQILAALLSGLLPFYSLQERFSNWDGCWKGLKGR